MQTTTTAPCPTHPAEPTVAELDAAWPKVKARVDKSERRVLEAACELVERPSDRACFDALEAAVAENEAAITAELDHHEATAAALRRERAWAPPEDRRATWEAA